MNGGEDVNIYIKNSIKKIIPQFALICICFVAILVYANGVSAATPGQVIICFDDGNAAAYSSAFTYMEANGDINGTAYVNGATIGDGNNTMTLAQIQQMSAAGWTIGNHGYIHQSFDGLTNEEITSEIQDNINYLTSNGLGKGAYDLAYPGGYYGATMADVNNIFGIMDDLGIQTGRDIDGDPLNLATADNYQIPGYIIQNNDTVATVESYINQVQTGSDVVLIFHDLVPNAINQNPNYYQYVSSDFDQIINYINNQGISTATIDQLYQEKQTLLTQTTLTVTALTEYKDALVNLVGKLTDKNGNSISGQTIHFSIDGIFIGDGVTNSSGIATYQYVLTQSLGTHNLTAEFVTGNNNIYAASQNTDINNLQIIPTPTNITLNSIAGLKNSLVKLIATITDNNGNPISGKTIQFLVDGINVGSNVTDATGTATLSHQLNESLGLHTLLAKFTEDNKYATSQNTSTLNVGAIPTNITLNSIAGLKNSLVKLIATITDNSGNPISGETIQFFVNGTNVGSNVTDAAGTATLSHQLNESLGLHTLLAKFTEDNTYATSQNTSTLNVGAIPTNILVQTVNGAKNTLVKLIATLRDNNNMTVQNKTIQFLIDGINVGSSTTDATGTATLSHNVTETQGSHNITAKFEADDTYLATSTNSTLTVPDTTAPTAWANLKSGYYNTNKVILLSMSEPGTIFYTLNGGKPTNIYNNSITISKTSKLSYQAEDLANNTSPIYTNTYTIDKIAPKVLSTTPKNKSTHISKTSSILIKFTENITASTYWSKIYVKNLNKGKKISISKKLSKNTLTIKTSKRTSNTKYQIYIPGGAVKDTAGNKLAAHYSFSFKTA